MSELLNIIYAVLGVSLIVMVLSDVFQSIIVPHYLPRGMRLSPLLVSKLMWLPLHRWMLKHTRDNKAETALTMFAPAAMMALLTFWLAVVTIGYALILFAVRAHVQPPLPDFESALYFAASSVLTIGFGDVVACASLGRLTVICAALSGLVLLAIAVSYMFAIQSHFHSREVASQIISSRHGHSGNGAVFYHCLKTEGNSASSLELAERWITEINQSHAAYPLLLYFRSRSPKASWLLQLNVVLDAVTIALAMQESEHHSLHKSIYQNGCRAVDTFSTYLALKEQIKVFKQDPVVFEEIFRTLGAEDPRKAANKFASLRQRYYPSLFVLSDYSLIYLPPLSVVNGHRIAMDAESLSQQVNEIAYIESPTIPPGSGFIFK
ncbi:MAG: two pore domain potassium channel family protein [Candidatus Obscuribacter sp.]|nr:two pore domain potassium channel family protein [Candidatus Obscuribacter sp.]